MAKKDRCRTGRFPWEEGAQLTLESFRGENDWMMSADCRCPGYQGIVDPWIALCSLENWGAEAQTPAGLPDGDTGWYEEEFVPLEELGAAADIFGQPISDDFSEHDMESHLDEYYLIEYEISAEYEPEEAKDELYDVLWSSNAGGFRVAEFLAEEPDDFFLAILEEPEEYHPWEDLPIWMKNSHWFSSGRTQDSKKELRMGNFSGYARPDRYKDRRLGMARMSRQKFRRAVAQARLPVYYDLSQPRRHLPAVLF